MAIPPEVEARLGPAITVDGMDAEQIKATLKTLYERYLPRKFNNSWLAIYLMSLTFFLLEIDIDQKFPFRWVGAESSKYDIEYTVKVRDMQIHDLEMEVSDMRGKFIIPKLKKVHTFKLMDES